MAKPWSKSAAQAIPNQIYRFFSKRDAIGFFYHVISDEPLAHIRRLYAYKSAAAFENDLLFLKRNFNLVSYQDLVDSRLHNKPLPARSVFVSFDDGCAECYQVARPLLLKHGVPCIFFITTSLIDNQSMLYRHKIGLCLEKALAGLSLEQTEALRQLGAPVDCPDDLTMWLKSFKTAETAPVDEICRALDVDVQAYLEKNRPYMTAGQVCTLAADGFVLGAHSLSHSKFNTLDAEAVEAELSESCRIIAGMSGAQSVPFAFPFSAFNVNRRLLETIRQKHPQVGLLFDSKGIRRDSSYIINRIWADTKLPTTAGHSDLDQHLRSAYEDNFAWRLERKIRKK